MIIIFMLELDRLRPHQKNAVEVTLNNNFSSGVHFHATGTGKSWISFYILSYFYKKYIDNELSFSEKPDPLIVFWICERKSILKEQFDRNILAERGFHEFLKKSFNIINYSENKSKSWVSSINSARFWKKPILVIINRGFLTSQNKYTGIVSPIHLILHDECHSITNNSTQDFYTWLFKKNNADAKCIGFSATPSFDDKIKINPFSDILSKFTIYNGCIENDVILKPVIERFDVSSDKSISLTQHELAQCIIQRIIDQPYKKIIVWAGMIHFCKEIIHIWKDIFIDFEFCIDTSVAYSEKDYQGVNLISYEEFYHRKTKAIIFCACKHKEGSDIPNLDTCVFLDYVEERGHQNFVQCAGRVLRKDKQGLKKNGLIIDIKAKSTIKLCDRLCEAFQLPRNIFPWKTDKEFVSVADKTVTVNILTININNKPEERLYDKVTFADVKRRFVRKLPNKDIYKSRLKREVLIIIKKKLAKYLFQAMDILDMTKEIDDEFIPHVTRGSCGSSLVCYLLGISHVDPIIHNISFARFLNEFRDNLPDIDFDFPYNRRDEIFLKLQNKWPGKIARISNHVHYHEKSARREAMRRVGIKGFIGKHELYDNKLIKDNVTKEKIEKITKELNETFRGYSLHCGGIVYYEDGIPENLLMKDKQERIVFNTIQQIVHDKRDVSSEKRFKIDILSSRGIAQLLEAYKNVYPDKLLSFEDESHIGDKKTCEMLARGDNIGITLAESPLIRKAFIKLKPKTLYDMAVCLSIIRPAASQAKQAEAIEDAKKYLIFDDDAIYMIKYATGCSEDKADKLRRMLSKTDNVKIHEAKKIIRMMFYANENRPNIELKEVFKNLDGLRKYSFCKSHAYSYAQLVWHIAFMKAHHPKEFWKATLNHNQSHYRGWVHKYEAHRAGINWLDHTLSRNDKSIYTKARNKNTNNILTNNNIAPDIQLRKTGYWNLPDTLNTPFFPDCYGFKKDNTFIFRGILANLRIYRNFQCNAFLGIGEGKYIEVHFPKKCIGSIASNIIGLKGTGKFKIDNPIIIECRFQNQIEAF